MNHWIFKSEPTVFGMQHLEALPRHTTEWSGVRNYQARNMLRDEVKVGDRVYFYHSNCKVPGIYGCMKVVKAGYPDPEAFNSKSRYYDEQSAPQKPIWYCVDVQLIEIFKQPITLDTLKQQAALKALWILRKGNRLSVTPITQKEWHAINALR